MVRKHLVVGLIALLICDTKVLFASEGSGLQQDTAASRN